MGRVVTGLDMNDISFAILPPHFINDSYLELCNNEMLPYYDEYPSIFKTVIPYLIASIIMHRKWLVETLPAQHPLFKTRFWCQNINEAKYHNSVITGLNRDDSVNMRATGVPPHLVVANQVSEIIKTIDVMKDNFQNILDKLPQIVVDKILDKFVINGTIPVTRQDIIEILRDTLPAYLSNFNPNNNNANTSNNNSNDQEQEAEFQWFTWSNGTMHCVPEDFRFPTRNNTKIMFQLWYKGDISTHIAPYRSIQPFDLANKADKTPLSRAKTLMDKLHNIAISKEWVDSIQEYKALSNSALDKVFDDCFIILCDELGETNYYKLQSDSYTTVSRKLPALNAKNR